jgi:RNA polymerase sigma factor (sigma-70 family)
VVLAAGRSDSPRQAEALERVCRTCWYPLYAHIRRRGHGPEDAQDLTQEFLSRLLEKNWLADLDPRFGRFRSFLLLALDRFLINEHDRRCAIKRGAGQAPLSLDQVRAEGRFTHEPFTAETPEQIFDRNWALAVLDQALEQLRLETASSGKARQFASLQPFLSREAETREYAAIAERLGMAAGAVGVAVHRLRQRYREVVRDVIAGTIANPAQVDEELRQLFAALRQPVSR